MPLYEYQCDACAHRFEVIHQKVSDAPPEKCPVCGGVIHKMQSAPAFHLKGTGWYATDYAKKDQPGSTRTDEGSKDSSKESADKGGGETSEKSENSKDSKDATKSTTSSDAAPSTSAGASTPTKTP